MKFSGTVQRGSEYGRTLGFPTANIPLDDREVSGSFVAVVWVGKDEYHAAVYADQANHKLEAHLLDFEGDLYGKEIMVELVHKIRESLRFASEEEAKKMIASDVGATREYFEQAQKMYVH